jgi:hypothetical protein
MKRYWIIFAILLTVTAQARAAWVYNGKLANETVLASTKTYTLDLSSLGSKEGTDRLSAQAVYNITGSTTAYATSGTVGMVWSVSNDGANYTAAVGVSSVTYTLAASTTAVTSTLWDFGIVDYRYLQLAVTKPVGGTLGLVVTVYGKN